MAKMPQGWTVAPVRDIAVITPKHPANTDPNLSVSFVPMQAVSEAGWRFLLDQERRFSDVRKGYTHFADGDVLLAKIKPCFENGKAAIARGLRNCIGCGTTELHVLRPLGGIKPEYLYHYLHQESFRHDAVPHMTGSAGQLRVPVSYIEDVLVPLPPIPEQHRIVAKLEELLGKVDACQKRLERIPFFLKRFRKSVLATGCSGKLTGVWRSSHQEIAPMKQRLPMLEEDRRKQAYTNSRGEQKQAPMIDLGNRTKGIDELFDLPETWEWVSLGQITWNIADGPHFSPKYVDASSGVPFISARNISYEKIDFSDAKHVSKADHREFIKRARPVRGDVLLTKGGTTGVATVVGTDSEFSIWVHIALLKIVRQFVLPEYLRDALTTPSAFAQSQAQTHGVGNQDLGLTRMVHIALPLPPIEEQEEIVRQVQSLYEVADQIESSYKAAKASVDQLRQSILAKAFLGELVPQDPNDEPAEVLLGRIRAGRECDNSKSSRVRTRNKQPEGVHS